jgi:hypothetical protein
VCAAAGAGTCTAGGGAGVQPNACADRVCDDGVVPRRARRRLL